MAGFNKPNSFVSLYALTKEFNIPPLSAKCALAQRRCFNKWKDSKCIINKLINNIPRMKFYSWCKESRTLCKKLSKFSNDEEIKNFYWDRDLFNNSIKAEIYKRYHFESTRHYIKLGVKYPELSLGFILLLRIRCGYKFDTSVARAAKLVDENCPKYCPCCKEGTQTFFRWTLICHTSDKV